MDIPRDPSQRDEQWLLNFYKQISGMPFAHKDEAVEWLNNLNEESIWTVFQQLLDQATTPTESLWIEADILLILITNLSTQYFNVALETTTAFSIINRIPLERLEQLAPFFLPMHGLEEARRRLELIIRSRQQAN